jgi:hypothetical protein
MRYERERESINLYVMDFSKSSHCNIMVGLPLSFDWHKT